MPATVPPEIAKALNDGDPAPDGLADDEKAAFDQMAALYTQGSGYAEIMVTRPQTVGYGLADSPAGLAAWFYDKFADWTYSDGEPERSLTKDEMLDDISLYWFTNTATSSARLYWENHANNFNAVSISIPSGITVFPGEIYRAPRTWAERSYHDLVYFNEVDKGGHFAGWEAPAPSLPSCAPPSDRCVRRARLRGDAERGGARRASAASRTAGWSSGGGSEMWPRSWYCDHMDEIGVRELKATLSGVLRRVSRGEQVRVTVRGRPVADIVPAGASPGDEALRALVARGRVVPPARARPTRPPRLARAGRSASELVLAEREDER
jgi:prevent-host-death family protein